MEPDNSKRSRIIGLRLKPKEYKQIEKQWKGSDCRKLSDYVRYCLFKRTIVTAVRNQSLDDLMTEASRIRNELNSIGNNLNQAVKKLHTLNQIPEFRDWLIAYEIERIALQAKMDDIKNRIQKLGEKWLQ